MFDFLTRNGLKVHPKIDSNTFLLWEPCSRNHAEVTPGFTKYLLDLGYSVSVLVEPGRIDEGLFSLFEENERVFLNCMSRKNIKKFLLKYGFSDAKGLLISTLTSKIRIKDIPLTPGQKILCVSHDIKDDAALIDENTIALRSMYHGGFKTVAVNPHYFGAVTMLPKNDIVNFISVGALRKKRRNVKLLIEAAKKLYHAGVRDFMITLVGKGKLYNLPKQLRPFFRILGRLEFQEMYKEIQHADFFLPLLDPRNPRHDRYITTGTSGSFQLIYGFLKPPVIASRFAPINGFDDSNSIIYENNADLAAAMEKAMCMTTEEYDIMRRNLKRYTENLYCESLENLRHLIEMDKNKRKRYLFFVSLAYSFSILRPLQEEIWRRGGEAAWFIEEPCEDHLEEGERRLHTIREVTEYNPIAVFAPGNWVYDFFPGVKVQVFHGYAINKRNEKNDKEHFTIRGWFDMYCTQGASSTLRFRELEKKHSYFKIYETGWCKVDPFFEKTEISEKERPVILYATTFSSRITSAPHLLETITQLAETKPWDWILTFHPKLDDPELIEKYRQFAETHPNVTFCRHIDGLNTFRKIDAMLCDSSSIIVEVMLLEKPVVTFRNTHPGNFLINVLHEAEIGDAIEKALTRPADLMENIRAYTAHHESHRDGQNSARVLDAVDDFILNYKGKIRKKPLNLFRRIALRLRIKYYKL